MRLRLCLLLILGLSLETAAVDSPAVAGHLLLSANDGKYPQVDGAYKVADPPEPDTLMILDVSKFPPQVVAEIEVMHGTPGTPNGVALTPDEKLALVSNTNKIDPKDKTKVIPDDALQVVDVEKELAAYRVSGTKLQDTGVRIKVKGYPAAIRIAPR